MRFPFVLDKPVTCKMHQMWIEPEALPYIRWLIEKKKLLVMRPGESSLLALVRGGGKCSMKPNVFRPGVEAVDLGFGESFSTSSQTSISSHTDSEGERALKG